MLDDRLDRFETPAVEVDRKQAPPPAQPAATLAWSTAATVVAVVLRVSLAGDARWLVDRPGPAAAFVVAAALVLGVAVLAARRRNWAHPSTKNADSAAPEVVAAFGTALLFALLTVDFQANAFTWASDPPRMTALAVASLVASLGAALIGARARRRRGWAKIRSVLPAAALALTAMLSAALVTQPSLLTLRGGILTYAIMGATAWAVLACMRSGTTGLAALTIILTGMGLVIASLTASSMTIQRYHPPPPTAERPSIFLITIDTLRADGAKQFTRIRRLIKDGVEFRQAFSNAPWTQSSVASFLTGRYPSEAGFGRKAVEPPDYMTGGFLEATPPPLAGVLSASGYDTLAVLTNSLLLPRYGFNAGFARFAHVSQGYVYRSLPLVAITVLLERLTTPGWLPNRADAVTALALYELDHRHAGRTPTFMWVHYIDPHAPYAAPSGKRTFSVKEVDGYRHGRPGGDIAASMRAAYDAEVRFTDQWVGGLLDGLKGRGLYRRSLIILTADHGEEFWEHGSVQHGNTLYREQLHVPLIVKLPGNRHAREYVDATVGLVDLMPTILTIVDVPTSDVKANRSLLPLVGASAERAPRPVFADSLLGSHKTVINEQKALRTNDYTVIVTPATGKQEVYDRLADPGEIHPLDTLPESQRELNAQLDAFATRELAATDDDTRSVTTLDPQREQQLKALGYLQ